MPWSPKGFAQKHNRKLTGAAAKTAARMATAMVRRGVPEGEAIATASKRGNAMMRGKPTGSREGPRHLTIARSTVR